MLPNLGPIQVHIGMYLNRVRTSTLRMTVELLRLKRIKLYLESCTLFRFEISRVARL